MRGAIERLLQRQVMLYCVYFDVGLPERRFYQRWIANDCSHCRTLKFTPSIVVHFTSSCRLLPIRMMPEMWRIRKFPPSAVLPSWRAALSASVTRLRTAGRLDRAKPTATWCVVAEIDVTLRRDAGNTFCLAITPPRR